MLQKMAAFVSVELFLKHMQYIEAHLPEHYEAAAKLINAYLEFLDEDLSFQHMDEEYKQLPVMYGSPDGCIILCKTDNNEFAGMVAVRNKRNGICEMKRLYVLPAYKGLGIGKELCILIISKAKQLGYKKMVLDTLERLQAAYKLYIQLGFTETEAYYENPLPGVVYFEKAL
ncbi:MAG: GNAT family N-acetyltransferase [Bacteroidota bacterium]